MNVSQPSVQHTLLHPLARPSPKGGGESSDVCVPVMYVVCVCDYSVMRLFCCCWLFCLVRLQDDGRGSLYAMLVQPVERR